MIVIATGRECTRGEIARAIVEAVVATIDESVAALDFLDRMRG